MVTNEDVLTLKQGGHFRRASVFNGSLKLKKVFKRSIFVFLNNEVNKCRTNYNFTLFAVDDKIKDNFFKSIGAPDLGFA